MKTIVENELRNIFTDMVIDVLGVDREEITPEANFFSDLGGESIDVLELSFMCKTKFNHEIKFQEMASISDAPASHSNELSDEQIDEIARNLPFIDAAELRQNRTLDTVQRLLTIENLFQFLRLKLSEAGMIATGSATS